VARAAETLGGFDALIHAVGRGFRGAFLELDIATWREAFELDLFAAVRVVRLAVPHLHPGGRIVLLGAASESSRRQGNPPRTPPKPRSPTSPSDWPTNLPLWD
jgi:NAD(P)-dependent dehydrogenase (short-subunit alcohol dehydrogenase family)